MCTQSYTNKAILSLNNEKFTTLSTKIMLSHLQLNYNNSNNNKHCTTNTKKKFVC